MFIVEIIIEIYFNFKNIWFRVNEFYWFGIRFYVYVSYVYKIFLFDRCNLVRRRFVVKDVY